MASPPDTDPDPVPEGTGLQDAAPVLDIVIPVHNEEHALASSVRAVHAHLTTRFPYSARITVADNASTDATLAVAHGLAAELDGVEVLHLDAKGRGRALHTAWLRSDAQVLAYMDVDLSTDLAALLPLVAPLVTGHSHLAIGTRLARGSRTVRGPKREIISRCYNLLLRGTLAARFTDAQCGFKAIRSDAAHELLPLVADTQWFFDTELLVLAERAGLRIHEVPVDWVDDPDSRVDIVTTALEDVRGIARIGKDLLTGRLPLAQVRAHLPGAARGPWADVGRSRPEPESRRSLLLHHLVRFALVGAASTLAYMLLYLLLNPVLGAQLSNLAALVLTAIANTAANRRLTFGIRGPHRLATQHGQGLIVFGMAWTLTSGSLALLHALAPGAGPGTELLVLVVANLAATLLRFVLLRRWVFGPRREALPDPTPADVAGPRPAATPASRITTSERSPV
ncbi:bifunctional glycosyltransferase family 2/GtrA family protein [Myceligenerans indicum]|uniref:dolichyl-phosphate beta-glucosyltransferase n=1 Tax=Myceligenerans indicum TaxID=2593663 RepID=A0ABS1LRE1_9MICO|nr:bifunctional glycosyltransferase family 2/GtrA family protein [Myceligenerans indicum]MBL0888583.1 bifunctional glycosyltransferase family 2/GtrA family protein [Myceligenerans indicum]